MSKAVLIFDMPDHCGKCPLRYDEGSKSYCVGDLFLNTQVYGDDFKVKPNWCPLVEMPQREPEGDTACFVDGEPMTNELAEQFMSAGWNYCIDRLEGR